MPKNTRRLNINFRQTKSERSATNSYRNFGNYLKGKVKSLITNR